MVTITIEIKHQEEGKGTVSIALKAHNSNLDEYTRGLAVIDVVEPLFKQNDDPKVQEQIDGIMAACRVKALFDHPEVFKGMGAAGKLLKELVDELRDLVEKSDGCEDEAEPESEEAEAV